VIITTGKVGQFGLCICLSARVQSLCNSDQGQQRLWPPQGLDRGSSRGWCGRPQSIGSATQ